MPSSFSSSTSPSHSHSSSSASSSPPMARGVEQLHFDVPLISTRRSASANASSYPDNDDDYIDTSRSVPFSWEAAPGIPKGATARTGSGKEEVSAPKPPPGQWRPEARVGRAPSFIMNRFLPAANALAVASLANARRAEPREELARLQRRRQRAVQTEYRAEGCGLVDLLCRFKSPVRPCRTPKLEAFVPRSRRINAGDGLSSDDGLSSRACKSPGWGLPLLDTSRLRIRGAGVDLETGRRLVEGRTSRMTAGPGTGRPVPMLKSPSEPWLAHALNSANRKN